jgi:predicted PurR-regulated permease PerM
VLVFLGVMGGAFAFGFLGIFLGPTLLATGYDIVRDWRESNLHPLRVFPRRKKIDAGSATP